MKKQLTTLLKTALCVTALCGCESYQAEPLPLSPDLVSTIDRSPLDRDAIGQMALANNPDLKAVRLDKDIAEAQRFQAGLLPDPQFNGALGILVGGPGTANAYTLGLAEDVRALIMRPAQIDAADAAIHQAEWSIAWQEWQTSSKAELLYIDTVEQAKLATVLKAGRNIFGKRLDLDRKAVERGDKTIALTAPEAASFSDLTKLVDDLDIQAIKRDHDLKALLGLAPETVLPLSDNIVVQELSKPEIDQALSSLASRRPDLLALSAGYESEEAKTRSSILGQFPAMVLGGSYGSDTTSVLSAGPAVTMDIPIFNRNQGNIRVEEATCAKLKAEYMARLDAAYNEAHAMAAAIVLLKKQLQAARDELPYLQSERRNAEAGFLSGDLDIVSYSDIVVAATTREAEAITLEQALLEDQLGLFVLLGSPPPPSESAI